MVYAEPNRSSCVRKQRTEQICRPGGTGGGSHIKEVEIDEDSLISLLKLHLSKNKKSQPGDSKERPHSKSIWKDFPACRVNGGVCARPPELVMGTNKPR